MTAQEAKQRLERIWKDYTSAYDTVSIEDLMAFDMAISALQAQPEITYCKDCECGHCEVWLCGDGSTDVYGYCGRTNFRVLPYDYCSWSERRENG